MFTIKILSAYLSNYSKHYESRSEPDATAEQQHKRILDIQHKGSYYNVFDESMTIKDLHAPTLGELRGFSSEIIVCDKGSFFSIYDESGKKINSRHSP